MYFMYYNPTDVDPKQLVNRDTEAKWLEGGLRAYLESQRNRDQLGSRAFCISGEKGMGKSILTRAAIERLRLEYSSNTLFLEIDCRGYRSWREILGAAARSVVDELTELKASRIAVSDALLATAKLLSTITTFDSAELTEIHEHIRQYEAAAALTGGLTLKTLNVNFGISVKRDEKDIKALTGKVTFDEHRLCKSLQSLFRDIRKQGFNVVLYIDNIDELQHDYREASRREWVRHQTEGIFNLGEAPIGLVLNMRTYLSGILPRFVDARRVLQLLTPSVLQEILAHRLHDETPEVQNLMNEVPVKQTLEKVGRLAPTPLAFLVWIKFLAEADALNPDGLEEGFSLFLETHYANIRKEVLHAVAETFDAPGQTVDAETILAACNGNKAVMAQLQDRQAILPEDFWNPVAFTLDPELFFLMKPNAQG